MVKDLDLFAAAMAGVKPLKRKRAAASRVPAVDATSAPSPPEATIDLHGMTLAVAERAVTAFLARVTAQDLRVVLVVTGKGLRREGERTIDGRIRAEFVGWLNRGDNRDRVRAVKAAHAHHGGTGAFYLLLRRRSSASSRSLRATPQR